MSTRYPWGASVGRRLLLVSLVLVSLAGAPASGAAPGATATPAAATGSAAGVTEPFRWEGPTATARLGEPAVFQAAWSGPAPVRVELLRRLRPDDPWEVRVAGSAMTEDGGRAQLTDPSHTLPNTTWRFRFRALLPDGSRVESPEATVTVADERFAWRTLTDTGISLHWTEGDDAFARQALEDGVAAVAAARELFGGGEIGLVDLFVYADEEAFYAALGPGTRENVGGQANDETRTMYALIEPAQVGSPWVRIVVAHELTHLVFAEVTRNPWSAPPRWLNEGIAVWLTEGYTSEDRARVESAARAGTLIPLSGLAGYFPTTPSRFSLAYATSASAIDHLVARWGREGLAAVVRAYGAGLGDDAAFRSGLGIGIAEFEAGWLAAIGGREREPAGPLPAPVGPLPPGWRADGPVS